MREMEKARQRLDDSAWELLEELDQRLAVSPRLSDLPEALDAWRILCPLAEGSLGPSLLVEPMGVPDPTPCVLKLFREPVATPIAKQQFDAAVELLQLLDSPHAVKTLDVGLTKEKHPYVVSPYVSGPDLLRWGKDRGLDERLAMFLAMAETIGYAHERKVLHLGLKPSELRVDEAGAPWVLGLGHTKAASPEPGAVETYEALLYASPEQIVGLEAGAEADVFSLGVLLQELLTAEHPFGGKGQNLLSVGWAIREQAAKPVSGLDPALQTILDRAMAKAPGDRYKDAAEFSRALAAAMTGKPVIAEPVTAGKNTGGSSFPRPLAWVLAGVLVIGGGYLAWQSTSAKAAEEVGRRVEALANRNSISAAVWKDIRTYLSSIEVRESTPVAVLEQSAKGWLRLAESQQSPPPGLTPDLPGALDASNRSIVVANELRRRDPASEEFLFDFAQASSFSRDLSIRLFRFNEATITAERDDQALRQLPTQNERLIESRAVNSSVLADLRYWNGNLESALTFRQDAFDQFGRLIKNQPADPYRLRNYARSAERLAAANSDLSKSTEALTAVGVAEPLDRRFSQQEPEKALRWVDLAGTLSEKARAFESSGNSKASLEAARESRQALEKALNVAPGDREALARLVARQIDDAGIAFRRQDYREARLAAERARAMVEKQQEKANGEIQYQILEAKALVAIADAINGAGDKRAAKPFYQRAIAKLEDVGRKAPLLFPEKRLLDRIKTE